MSINTSDLGRRLQAQATRLLMPAKVRTSRGFCQADTASQSGPRAGRSNRDRKAGFGGRRIGTLGCLLWLQSHRAIEAVAAFDVDERNVERPLHEATFARPNCTTVFQRELSDASVTVQMGPVLDGIADHMGSYPDDRAFRVAKAQPLAVSEALKSSGAEILVCYLPIGSEQAVRHYATTTQGPVLMRASPWSIVCRSSSLPSRSSQRSSQRRDCRSSATISRASSVPRCCIESSLAHSATEEHTITCVFATNRESGCGFRSYSRLGRRLAIRP